MQAQQFWDQIYADLECSEYREVVMADVTEPSLSRALAHFGDLQGKTLVDLGCGRGEKSLVFASRGANVISVDLSEIALNNLAEHCREHGITNIRPVKLAAHDILQLGQIDFIYGSMILHHIEPFDDFVDKLGRLVRPEGKGFFTSPVLLEVEPGAAAPGVHGREVFGPVATVVPYTGKPEDAAEIVGRGRGGLVSSIYSEDVPFTADLVLGVAPFHGRVFLGSAKIAEASPGPGTVLPLLVHGGPGRAGGGEELGGLRGLALYMQRVALEGSRPVIERITGSRAGVKQEAS